MAVFTPLSDAQVATFLDNFDVGGFVFCKDRGGTENSTFFVTTQRRELVLTLLNKVNMKSCRSSSTCWTTWMNTVCQCQARFMTAMALHCTAWRINLAIPAYAGPSSRRP